METGLLHLHNVLRWLVLIFLLISVFKSFGGWKSGKTFTNSDRKTWLFTLIFSHINLLIGLVLLFIGPKGITKVELPEGSSIMKVPELRFFWVEHPLLMIIGIILITAAYGKSKKPIADTLKFKKAFWLFFFALLAIIAAIPWPFRAVIGRGLFPGM